MLPPSGSAGELPAGRANDPGVAFDAAGGSGAGPDRVRAGSAGFADTSLPVDAVADCIEARAHNTAAKNEIVQIAPMRITTDHLQARGRNRTSSIGPRSGESRQYSAFCKEHEETEYGPQDRIQAGATWQGTLNEARRDASGLTEGRRCGHGTVGEKGREENKPQPRRFASHAR